MQTGRPIGPGCPGGGPVKQNMQVFMHIFGVNLNVRHSNIFHTWVIVIHHEDHPVQLSWGPPCQDIL